MFVFESVVCVGVKFIIISKGFSDLRRSSSWIPVATCRY